MSAKNTYRVTPVNGADQPYNVQGTRIEHDDSTGATKVFDGDDLVARVLNASVTKVTAE